MYLFVSSITSPYMLIADYVWVVKLLEKLRFQVHAFRVANANSFFLNDLRILNATIWLTLTAMSSLVGL